jgi:[histone H3]-lysine27 N-trimethyltransferase EZH2
VSMRRHAHLLMAESSIDGAGWGLYNKQALKKGDYIHEYVGEVISQEEAERRGRIYDKVNRSYLFNLTADFVVDASRKGNKTRFINHSAKPNCSTRLMLVNGTMRIGLFAKEDIEAQSEVRFLIDLICLQLNFSYQELIFAIRSFSTIAMMLA